MNMETRYQIILDGKIASGHDLQEVKQRLSKVFRVDAKTIERLFASQATVVKEDVDYQTATTYKQAIEQTGATCQIKAMTVESKTRASAENPLSQKTSARPRHGRLMMCPKCGFEQKKAPRCERCGIEIKSAIKQKPREQSVPSASSGISPYILARRRHFTQEEFRITESPGDPDFPFTLAASKVRFDIVGFPVFLEEFFIFHEIPQLEKSPLEQFNSASWEWALAHENPLPPAASLTKSAFKLLGPTFQRLEHNTSVREFTAMICVYAIAVSGRVSSDTLDWVHAKNSAHYEKDGKQAGFIVPLVFDTRKKAVHHFQKAPLRGRAHYSEAKKVILRHLIP
jgi:hypothetical protein